MLYFRLSIAAGTVIAASLAAKRYHTWDDATNSDLTKRYAPAISATILWSILSFCFLIHESVSTFSQKAILTADAKKKQVKPPSMASIKYGTAGGTVILNAKRTVGNLMEQTPIFLVGVWLHAVFVNPLSAAQIAWTWLAVQCILSTCMGYSALDVCGYTSQLLQHHCTLLAFVFATALNFWEKNTSLQERELSTFNPLSLGLLNIIKKFNNILVND